MTTETALFAAVSALGSAVIYLWRIGEVRSAKCEKDGDALRDRVRTLEHDSATEHGRAVTLEAIIATCETQNCQVAKICKQMAGMGPCKNYQPVEK